MKKHLFLKSLLIAIGLLVTGLTTQTWADDLDFSGNSYIFIKNIKPDGWGWGSPFIQGASGEKDYLYVWGNNDATGYSANAVLVSGTAYEENAIYAVKMPEGNFYGSILARDNDINIGSTWNQTGTMWLQTGKNYLKKYGNSYEWDTYIPASTASLSASSTSITTAESSTLTPSLSSNTNYNEITSTAYSVSTNPGSAGSVTSGGVFSATAAGTYVVTATVTYNAKDFTGITNTATATKTITVSTPAETTHSVSVTYVCTSTSATVSSATNPTIGEVTYSEQTAPTVAGYTFVNWTLGTGLAKHASYELTSNPIRVKTNSSGSGYTLRANYNEDLTTSWKLIGDNQTGSPFGDNYAYASGKEMTKKSGASTTNKAYKTLYITALPADNYGFKVATAAGNTYSYGWGDSEGYYRTFDRTASTAGTKYDVYTGDQHQLKFVPDALGEYEFEVDYTTTPCSVKVTFPTAYTVTYSKGSVNGSSGSITATYSSASFASGTKIQSGKSVTLTAPAAKTGYSWKGWYTNADGTTGQIDDDERAITVTVNAAKTLYACYTEDSYTVTVNASSGGQVSYNGGVAGSSCSASAGVATKSQTISAIPNTGYAFVGWTNVDEEHHITKYTATWNNTNKGWDLTVNADAATTITANFAPRFALVGAIVADGNPTGGMPGWANENQVAFAYSDGAYTLSRTLTSPNTSYAFKIIDRLASSWVWRGHSSSTNNLAVDNTTTYTLTENGGNNVFFDSRGVGSYTFTVVEEEVDDVIYPKVKIQDGANSHVVTWGYVSDNGQEGGTITSVVDGEATPNNIVSGKYVKDGGSITVTAAAVTPGYRFIDFRTSSTYGGGSQLSTSNPYTVASVEADQNIYAQFAENLCTVTITANDKTKGSIRVGGEDFAWDETTDVGVYNYKSLVVTPVAGYYFSGWTLSSTPDFEVDDDGESGASTNLRGLGGTHGSTGTLTANFVELDKIYFRNIFDDGAGDVSRWDSVYVGFGAYWTDGTGCSGGPCGAGVKPEYTTAAHGDTTHMERIGDSDVYWAYVPRAFTNGGDTHVAFYNKGVMGTWGNFYENEASYLTDYNRALNMFIPYHTSSTTNSTKYYNSGYWRCYSVKAKTGAGYYLQTTRGTDLAEFKGQADNSDKIECTVRVDQHDQDKEFHIVSAGGKYFEPYNYSTSTYPTITSTASTMTMKGDDTDGLTVTLTSEGNYRFIIDQSGEVMELTVIYPISVGDYRIKHSYSDSGTKYAYSDMIKGNDSHPTVSMFYNPSSATMVLQKCTTVTVSGPEWDAGKAITMTRLNKGAGVYQFDLTIADDAGTIDEGADLYGGPFYIKTDCAPGSWANYMQNVMDKNTINPTAFDYYFMKWLDLDTDNNEKKNIKCVIANQYNNAISDTLKSDGIATMVDGEPVLDNDGSVRFSYNSKTNALERAYLTGASNLTLETYAEGYITNYGGSTDQYGRHPGFVDDVVWTYELTVDAKLGAKAGVQATWINKAGTSKNQTLIANTNPIISGTGSGKYTMRLVFDFKTNSLISTWTPSGAISDKLSDVDVMLVREGQDPSDVITFSGTGSLAPRKLVGSLKFTKTNYEGKVSAWNSTTRPLLTFFVSFPFDVKVSDIFGLNSAYGDAYVIRRYAGDERAAKGFFRGDGTTSFWEDLTLDSVMHAYQGYIVVLDNDYFNSNAYGIWGDKSEQYLYFPSVTPGTIVSDETTITIPSHECKINRTWYDSSTSQTLNHKNTDSHWNLIGVPVFTTITGNSGTAGSIANVLDGSGNFHYFYEWDSEDNDFGVGAANGYSFKAMHGYMVQYCGDITFTGSVFTPSSVAARRTPMTENYNIELQVLDNDAEMLNHTYVELRENAHTDFELNEDVYLSPNNRAAEIYSFAGDYDVAANVLPIENQTVHVGLNVHKAGTYTIAMPSNFSGTATLIDTYNNTRTNLAIDDYEVTLPKGACNDRFLLDINIHKVPTAIDGVDGGSLKDGKAHKYIENDQMYILKNGTIYNAQGAKVK